MDRVTFEKMRIDLVCALETTGWVWSPAVTTIGDVAFAAAFEEDGVVVNYHLNMSESSYANAKESVVAIHISREVHLPSRQASPVVWLPRGTVRTAAMADYDRDSQEVSATGLSTLIRKMLVELQEAAATLTLKADGVSHV